MTRARFGLLLLAVAGVVFARWLHALYRSPAVGDLSAYWQLVVAVVTLVVAVVQLAEARRSVRAPVADDVLDAQLADRLAHVVGAQWKEEAAERRLLVPNPIPVRWTRPTAAVVGPVAAATGSRHLDRLPGVTSSPRNLLESGDVVRDLHDVYAAPGSGRLVVVGAPGSGKSAAAVLLVRAALEHRAAVQEARRPEVPVPVLFTLQGWNPHTERLCDWLVAQLRLTYVGLLPDRHSVERARRLIEAGRIAVVLDGLDELAPELRSAALEALDRQVTFRLVLLSRGAEMAEAVDRGLLRAAAAVELRDVAPATAADYLQSALGDPAPPAWQELLRQLRTEPSSPVTVALRNPLALTLLRDTYDVDDSGLLALLAASGSGELRTPEAVEAHLLGRVIPTAYRQEPGDPQHPYGAEYAERALTLLAQRLTQAGTADLAWWRVTTWTARLPRALVVGLLAGVVPWLLVGPASAAISPLPTVGLGALLGAWLVARPQELPTRWPAVLSRPAVVLAVGTILGLVLVGLMLLLKTFVLAVLLWVVCTVAVAVAGVWWIADRAVRMRRPGSPASPPRARHPFPVVLVVGVALGYALQGGAVLVNSQWVGLGTLLAGLLVLGVGLTFGLGSPGTRPAAVNSPYGSWRDGRWPALGTWLTLAAFAGAGLPLVVLAVQSPSSGVTLFVVGLVVPGLWVIYGLLLGTTFPESWEATLGAAQLSLAHRLRVPAGLMAFLEDARRRNVLRTVGPVYQFRHVRLQELLAAPVPDRARRPAPADVDLDGERRRSARLPAGPRALTVGVVSAVAFWLGQAVVDPALSLTGLGGQFGIAVGLGAALGAGVLREVDGPDARWAFLLRRPVLVLAVGAALGFRLARYLAGYLSDALLLQITLSLPVGIALWLLFGLLTRAVAKDGQVLATWRAVNASRPLGFVVGGGLGWVAALTTARLDKELYWNLAAVVAAVVVGLLLLLSAVPLGDERPSADRSPHGSWNPGRRGLLALWFVLGAAVTATAVEAAIRISLQIGLAVWPTGWAVVLTVALASGYVVGRMFPVPATSWPRPA